MWISVLYKTNYGTLNCIDSQKMDAAFCFRIKFRPVRLEFGRKLSLISHGQICVALTAGKSIQAATAI